MPNANLLNEDLKSVPFGVKFHDIPIMAFAANRLSVMDTKLGNPIMLDSYTSSMCIWSWGRMDYARALIDIRANREVKEDTVIAIPNVEDDGEVLQMVRVEYEWEPPRCGVCMVKPKKPIRQVVSKKNSASSSGTKNNFEVSRKVMSSTNPFNARNTIEEGNELGSYRGSSNSGKKVVQDMAGSASGSQSNTPLVAMINFLESQMIEGKLVLLDDEALKNGSGWGYKSLYEQWKENHGEDPYDDDDFDDPGLTDAQTKLINAFDINLLVDDLVNEDIDSDVEEAYDETATYMASTTLTINNVNIAFVQKGMDGKLKACMNNGRENHGERGPIP
ncbi:hypothetical protein Tco_1402025 [Tanacetum coccineum]